MKKHLVFLAMNPVDKWEKAHQITLSQYASENDVFITVLQNGEVKETLNSSLGVDILSFPITDLGKLIPHLEYIDSKRKITHCLSYHENLMPVGGAVREHFNLPGMHKLQAERVHNKHTMKFHLQKKGIPISPFHIVNEKSFPEFAKQYKKSVLKPLNLSGNSGLQVITESTDLTRVKLTDDMILEEFIEGKEV